jgi:hypothetical protein
MIEINRFVPKSWALTSRSRASTHSRELQVRLTAAVRIARLYVEDNEGRSLADSFRRHRRIRFLARGLRRRLTVAARGPNF